MEFLIFTACVFGFSALAAAYVGGCLWALDHFGVIELRKREK